MFLTIIVWAFYCALSNPSHEKGECNATLYYLPMFTCTWKEMTALEILHRECMIFEQIAKLYIYVHKILFNIVNFIVVVKYWGLLYAKLYLCNHDHHVQVNMGM